MPEPDQPLKPSISIYPNSDALAVAATDLFHSIAQRAIAERGAFSVLLSGGTTSRSVYSALAQPEWQLEWEKVHFFWGDERCVPPEHTDSNYRMVRESLLARLTGTPSVHRMHGDLPPREAAVLYEAEMRFAFDLQSGGVGVFPAFDLVLLGMGEDGHTASLFPDSPVLNEKERWVTWVEHNQPPPPLVPRLTVTLPLINAARCVVFLVTGANKSQRVSQVLGSTADVSLPAAMVQPQRGQLIWLVDEAAAKDLDLSEMQT